MHLFKASSLQQSHEHPKIRSASQFEYELTLKKFTSSLAWPASAIEIQRPFPLQGIDDEDGH